MQNRTHSLTISAVIREKGQLVAPKQGRMERIIKKSVNSYVEYTLIDNKQNRIIKDASPIAGLELMW